MNDTNQALQKIGALDAGNMPEIGHRNWHAISAGIELTIRSLNGRPLDEFQGALKQLEELMPELATEIGSTQEVLDLPKVNALQRFIAMILERPFPAFRSITQRAELRERAQTRLKGLERINDRLQELRDALNDRIADEAMRRASDEGNRKLIDEYENIQKHRREIREIRARLDEVFESKFLRYEKFELDYNTEVAEMKGFLETVGSVTGHRFLRYESRDVVPLNMVRNLLIGFRRRIEDEHAKLNRQLEALVRKESPKLKDGAK